MKSIKFTASILITTIFVGLLPTLSKAQSPLKISYQAVIRNSNNELLKNQMVGMRISILSNSADGNVEYTETQTPTTNSFGLIAIEIGNESSGNNFLELDWSEGIYFIKTETDPNGGTDYTISGTNQLLSVPFSFHSNTTDSIIGGISEVDPVFLSTIASSISESDTAMWNNKLDSFTETDPEFNTSLASGITQTDTANWNSKLNSQDYQELKNQIGLLNTYILELQAQVGVSDVEENHYSAVKIGLQIWMAENLKTTKFYDDTAIPNEILFDAEWFNLTTSAYRWYSDDIANKPSDGGLYNRYAVQSGKLCPIGWRVPTNEDWQELINFVGESEVNVKKLKSKTGWQTNNLGEDANGTNELGFNSFPTKFIMEDGTSYNLDHSLYWGNSGGDYDLSLFELYDYSNTIQLYPITDVHDYLLKRAFPCRCIKNTEN